MEAEPGYLGDSDIELQLDEDLRDDEDSAVDDVDMI